MSAIKKFLNNPEITVPIAVVGDVIHDVYHQVSVNRISPEFPIPIMLSKTHYSNGTDSMSSGGAANVAEQFRNFTKNVKLFTFNDYSWMHQIPVKHRFYQGDFPIARWDVEVENYGLSEKHLIEYRNEVHDSFHAYEPEIVILSDYDKGFFDSNPARWLKRGISIVDPKNGPLAKWKGCTIIKPNSVEAEKISGQKNWKKQADYFESKTEAAAVLITQGGNGVVGKIFGDYFEYRPKKTVVANSVVGAGDCFVAFLAMALSRGLSYLECVEVAFEAGCVYVQNKHNQPISINDLFKHDDPYAAKIVDYKTLINRDYSLVFANGCFDVLHEGHVELLKFAKTQGDKLVVALNSDQSVRNLKGKNRPINSLDSRCRMLSLFEFVDFIVTFEEDTPLKMIEELRPESIVKGGDYKKSQVVGKEYCGKVLIFPLKDNLSTTSILNKIY